MSRMGVLGVVFASGAVVALGGCSSSRLGPGGVLEPYVDGQFVCVDATTTVAVGAQQPPADAPSGCRTSPDTSHVMDLVTERSMCGPCGFELDAAKTMEERSDYPTACCYHVESPPPPR